MIFNNLGLMDELLRAIADLNYSKPTPIQLKAIPEILKGHDVLASAQTGTGKTASFTLPLLQRLAAEKISQKKPMVRALILTPTRELANQVVDSVRQYGKYLSLRSAEIFGGVNFQQQLRALRSGVDIVVATPGRLLDHVARNTIDLSQVKILVLDEADRMLDMGFMPAIKKVLACIPKQRQTLLFSATFSGAIKNLANQLLREPVTIQIGHHAETTRLIKQTMYKVERTQKKNLLLHFLQEQNFYKVLVFTRTKHGANRLAMDLEDRGHDVAVIHGDKSQAQRLRALTRFKRGKIQVLVATDVAARGLDIEELPYVLNFDMPQLAEDYIHRIGRTGRAGSSGEAISFIAQDDLGTVKRIQALFKEKIPLLTIPGFETKESDAAKAKENFSHRKSKNSSFKKSKPFKGRNNPKRFKQERAGHVDNLLG